MAVVAELQLAYTIQAQVTLGDLVAAVAPGVVVLIKVLLDLVILVAVAGIITATVVQVAVQVVQLPEDCMLYIPPGMEYILQTLEPALLLHRQVLEPMVAVVDLVTGGCMAEAVADWAVGEPAAPNLMVQQVPPILVVVAVELVPHLIQAVVRTVAAQVAPG